MDKIKKTSLIGRIVCIAVVVIFLPLLIVNLTLIIKGIADDETPPDIFGYMPLAVLSGSMDNGEPGCIKINDMIFVKKGDPQTYVEGDIITFRNGEDVITHRVVAIHREGDKIVFFETKGDSKLNNVTDGLIPVENVYGKYEGRLGGLGGFAIFLKTPAGIAIFAGIPIAAVVVFEIITITQERRRSRVADEKDAEIERLRSIVEAQGKGETVSPSEEVKAENNATLAQEEETAPPNEVKAENNTTPAQEKPNESADKQ